MEQFFWDDEPFALAGNKSFADSLKEADKKIPKTLIALKSDRGIIDVHQTLSPGESLVSIHKDEDDALEILRHSTAHIMADAVLRIFPEAKITIGPTVKDGFYYDFDLAEPFKESDLKKIEKEMIKIASKNVNFNRVEVSREVAEEEFKSKEEKYKLELIREISEEKNETLSFYEHGEFTDLCRGPHLPSTKFIKHFKLLSVAGSYWRGDEKRERLQRIYGTAFFSKEDLNEHLNKLEEAKKRDHRKIGKEMDLFSIQHDSIGAGLVLWHPKGSTIRNLMEEEWKKIHRKFGYDFVYSPHVGWSQLWKTSGHLENFNENMFSGIEVEGNEYFLKPMNCPFHIKIFNNSLKSYRDLPVRYAEMGTVYRYERSGVLHGLMRVRGFTQDDAHIFCTQEQAEEEIINVLKLAKRFLGRFGFSDFEIYVATKPGKAVGEDEEWKTATEALMVALDKEGLKYTIDEGGGAFYGPKIDIKIKDAIGRSWQCSTIQFDFNLPRRFSMSYIDSNSNRKHPYVIHRAIFGSLERFMGVYIEHTAGDFPFWISPIQLKVLPINQRNLDYSKKVLDLLSESEYRAKLDLSAEKLGAKIRNSRLEKIPYLIIIGDQEEAEGKVQIRNRSGSENASLTLDELVGFLKQKADQ